MAGKEYNALVSNSSACLTLDNINITSKLSAYHGDLFSPCSADGIFCVLFGTEGF